MCVSKHANGAGDERVEGGALARRDSDGDATAAADAAANLANAADAADAANAVNADCTTTLAAAHGVFGQGGPRADALAIRH